MSNSSKSFQTISRRQLLKTSALGAGSLVLLSFLPQAVSQTRNQKLKTSISRNHGHVFSLSLEEVLKAGPRVYNIKGRSTHAHEIELTQEILDTLQKTRVVEIESTRDFMHDHIVRLEII